MRLLFTSANPIRVPQTPVNLRILLPIEPNFFLSLHKLHLYMQPFRSTFSRLVQVCDSCFSSELRVATFHCVLVTSKSTEGLDFYFLPPLSRGRPRVKMHCFLVSVFSCVAVCLTEPDWVRARRESDTLSLLDASSFPVLLTLPLGSWVRRPLSWVW